MREENNIFLKILEGLVYGREMFTGYSHDVKGVNLVEPKIQTRKRRKRTINLKRIMIIKRKEKKLYYISSNPNLSGETISPTVPNNFLTRQFQSGPSIPRVCLYETVSDAISGQYLGQKLDSDSRLFLYEVSGFNNDHLLEPSISQAPYILVLREFWYTLPVRLTYIGEISIEGLDREEIYHYGPRSTEGKIYRWKWKEKLKSWQRSKL